MTTTSFVRAVKRTPTGSERRADCNAMRFGLKTFGFHFLAILFYV